METKVAGNFTVKLSPIIGAALLAMGLAASSQASITSDQRDAGAMAQAQAQAPAPAPAPQRIVSLNLCTDQLLMQMAPPQRIRAVSYLARDPRSSGMVEQALLLPQTSGAVEEVIAMQPDLVLAGTFSTRETVAILKRLGYRVIEFEPASDFEGIIGNIAKLADALGEQERGAQMAAQIRSNLAALAPPPAQRPVYADYSANGYISGEGTLIAAVANLAGFETLGQSLGIAGMRAVSLEQMLVSRPDVIDLGSDYGAPALATENYRHPAMQRLMREGQVANIPPQYTACGTMDTLRAVQAFADLRQAL